MSRWGELIPHSEDDPRCLCGCLDDEPVTEPRSLTVPYGLPRYQVRQHLELNGIEFTEDRRTLESVFQVTATDEQWEAVNRVAVEVWG